MDRIHIKTRKIYDRIPHNCKVSFFSTIIFGLIAHLYMFTNKFPNYDDMRLNSFGATVRLGRWFLWLVGATAYHLGLVYSLPLINGLISIVLLAISGAIIVDLLEIKNNLSIIIVSAILVVFPSWTATFFFMFTAPYYALAVLLLVLGVFSDFKYNKKILSILCIACSLGIYQAYLPFGATLYVVVLMLQLLKDDSDANKLFKKALSSLFTLMAGVVVYYIIMKITLAVTGQQLADYKGVNSLGAFSIYMIPDILERIVRDGLGVAFNNNLEISYGFLIKVGYLFLYVADIAISIISMVSYIRRKEYKKLGLQILLIATFIIAVNSIFIMCPTDGAIYSLMTYAYTFLIIFPICLVDKVILSNNISWNKISEVIEYGVILVSFVMVLMYCHFANAQYLSMNLGFEQATSYYTSLITQIKSVDGYRDDMSVALVGYDNILDSTLYRNEVMEAFNISGRDDVLAETYSIVWFLEYYCGFSPNFTEDYDNYMDEINEMPTYPLNGSIKIIDDIVIVKFS